MTMPGIQILSKMIATDATHDACERYPPPNVHTGTRTKILEVLTAWINDLSLDQERLKELLKVRQKYVGVLDICYRASLSSGGLNAVLANLPGFGVIQEDCTIDSDMLECFYRLEGQKILSILGETESPWLDESGVRLSSHVIEFLTDKERAG
jgi:predicted XRE-type DNA-binding protein